MIIRNDISAFNSGVLLAFLFISVPIVLILFVPSEADIGNPIVTMTGSSKDERFGWNVSNAGDVNRDGYDDIIVGAPGYDNERGRVYIFFGGPWFSGELKDEYANITINGSALGERFGWDVAYAGDVNNDGTDDVIVGAPGNNNDTGAAYIYCGQSFFLAAVKFQKANQTFTGEEPGDEFGSSVSGAGDVNADGFDDVIVGAPSHDGKTGKAFIFLGNSYTEKQLKADKAEVMFWGEKYKDCFGFSVSRAGNVNRDAYDDVIIGAPGADKTYVFLGGDPMNTWIQSTEEDFNSAQTRVHVNTTRITNGEVRLDTFNDVKIMTAYYDGSNPPDTPQIPRSRTWDQQIWKSEKEANGFGLDSNNWFVIKSGSVRKNEKILAVSDAAKDINVQISDGILWDHSMELAGTLRDDKYRGFDIAYESISGNALIAYSNDSSLTKQIPKYRIWNGTEWSAEMDTQAIGTADIHWIVLVSNPLSDEILMVTLDRANKDIYAQVWNGSAWGNVVLIESQASRDDCLCLDVTYEQQSGYGMIVWGGDSGSNKNMNYRRWKGGNGNWSEPQVSLTPAKNQVNWVRLAPDFKTNYILMGLLDNGKEIDVQIWNGSAWSPQLNITGSAERNAERCFDIAWEANGDREGLIVYGIGDHRPAYRKVTDTLIGAENFVLDALSPDNGRKPNWIVLKSDPQSCDIMLMYLVDDGGGNGGAEDDIGAELWNGSGWVYPMRIEYNSTRDNGQSYDFAYTDTSGYFISAAFDAKNTASWGRIFWTEKSPLHTTMKIRTRTSSDGATWSLWSDWYDKYNRIKSPKNRWIQYQVYLETANVTLTPELYDIHIELNHANITINGTTGEWFGWSVSYAGDIDNDSYDDIIIGAPQNESSQGAAYIFHGKMLVSELEKDRYLSLSSGESSNVTLRGQSEGDLFGYSVSFAGNINGDAYDDIIVGAPNSQKRGAAYVILGKSSLPPKIESMKASYIFAEGNEIDCFGWSVSYAGDVINTTAGCDEMLVGAPLFDAIPNENSGKAYIFHLYYQPDLLIDGEINDEYQEIPFGPQDAIIYLPEGENATWWILLENDGILNDAFDFIIDFIMPLGWSWRLTENSTGTAILNGDSVHLAPGDSNNYTLRISSPKTANAGDECWITIKVCSQNNTFKRDSVKGLVHIIDVIPPRITDTTFGFPSTGDLYTISANITDNMALDEVHLYYWFDLYVGGTDGPHKVSMDPGFVKVINVPVDGIKLHYNISANDTSDNKNETGITQIDVIDNDIPTIYDSTVGFPTTGDPFKITAFAIDNILVDRVYIYYWFNLDNGGTEGPFSVTMDPGFTKDIYVPHNATTLHYNITVNDTSDNWNEIGITILSVLDNDLPILVDITSGLTTTGDIFTVTVYATDNIQVADVHVFFWFETTGGFIAPLNRSMSDFGNGNYLYGISIPSNALVLHYKIYASDTSDNLNETGFSILEVIDNDAPDIIDTTSTSPTTGDTCTITASVSDNIGVVEVHLHYWLDLYGGEVDGPYDMLMDIGYSKIINITNDAIMLHYNISANDTSYNWNKTSHNAIAVADNDLPIITDTTFGNPTTGENFAVTSHVIDNICLDEVHLFLWFDTTYGPTEGQNYSMNYLGEWNYVYLVNVPANAIQFHYNISANDTSDNWGEKGLVSFDVQDNDPPQINGISVTPSPQEAWQAVNITVNIIDEIEVNEVWVTITYPDGSWENTRMIKEVKINGTLSRFMWCRETMISK